MKWKEFRRIAEAKGWQITRHGSEHDIYYHPDKPGERLIIERHGAKEIKKGLFNKLKKQVGI